MPVALAELLHALVDSTVGESTRQKFHDWIDSLIPGETPDPTPPAPEAGT